MNQFAIRLLVIALLAGSILWRPASTESAGEVVFGVLYANEPGQTASTRAAAAQIGAQAINEYFQRAGDSTRVRLVLRQTGKDPARAAAAVQELYDQGIRVFIGPETSAEVQAIEGLPFARDIVVVSYASTAASLARRAAPLFRLAPNDRYQAQAITQLMADDGVQTIVPLWRDDVYGSDLAREVRGAWTALGRTASPGTSYPPGTTDYSTALRLIGQQVAQAQQSGGPVAVYAATLDEIAPLLKAAAGVPGLGDVAWYGSDGAVLDRRILSDPASEFFAWQTRFIAPLYGEFLQNEQTKVVSQAIRDATNLGPEPYALTTYDTVVLAGLAASAAGGADNAQRFSAAFADASKTYYGVTGRIVLDQSGDRITGSYDFWGLSPQGGELFWLRTATYTFDPGAGTIERFQRVRRPALPVQIPAPSGR